MRPLLLTLVLALALAAPATAQGPAAQEGYTPDGPQVIEQTRESGDSGGGRLPFTGVDLVFLAGIGTGLVAVGAGMRRLTQPLN